MKAIKEALESAALSVAVLLMISYSLTGTGGFSWWQQASPQFSPFSCDQSAPVKLLHNCGKDSNCCWERAAEMGALQHSLSGKDHSDGKMWIGKGYRYRFLFFFSWPFLPFVLRESCPNWLCLLWMICSTEFEIKGGLITHIVFVV